MEDTRQIPWQWERQKDDSFRLLLRGEWKAIPPQDITIPQEARKIVVCPDGLKGWDSSLAAFLYSLARGCRKRSLPFDAAEMPDGIQKLLRLSLGTEKSFARKNGKDHFLEKLGKETIIVWSAVMTGLDFTGNLVSSLVKLLFGRARMRWEDVWTEVRKAGPEALFIVSLIAFLMGLILAFIGSIPLKWFRAELYVSSLIGIGMCRLMGAVMAGVVMAGRTGAAYAAELGTMQVNEEIDAMESMGIPPMEFLVLPRFLALTFMLPLLTVFADLIGILGGMVVGVYYMELSSLEYWSKMAETTRLSDLLVGVFTSWVFGMLIAICGCLRGMKCGRSSAGVGQATTEAMVSSIICLVISTALITVLTVKLGI